MKRFLFLVLAIISISSYARLGETLEQCKKRYGKPFEKSPTNDFYFFHKGDFFIMTMFLKDSKKCNYILYIKPNPKAKVPGEILLNKLATLFNDQKNKLYTYPISENEISILKKIYSKNKNWLKFDGYEMLPDASVFCLSYPSMLKLYDRSFLLHIKDIQNKEKQKLKGF